MSMFSNFADPLTGEIVRIRSYRQPRLRVPVYVDTELPTRTKRSPDHVKAADINHIVSRYKKTGELPVSQRAGMFSDMSSVDLKEALDVVRSAEQSFAALPARVRASFNNDPNTLLRALDASNDPRVHQYLFDAGVLAEPPKAKVEGIPDKGKAAKAKAEVKPDAVPVTAVS